MDGKIIALLIVLGGLLPSLSLYSQGRSELVELASKHHALGVKYFYDNWDSTFYYTQLAAQEREELYADSLSVDLGKSNFNAGSALHYRSHYAKALSYLERALAVYTQLNLSPDQAHRIPVTCIELAQVYAGLGDYEKAKDQLSLAAAIVATATEETMHRIEGRYPAILSERGGILMVQDSLPEAIEVSTHAVALYEELMANGKDYLYQSLHPRTNLAGALNKRGDYAAALAEYKILISGYSAYEDEAYNLALNQNNLADMLVKMDRLKEARQTLIASENATLASGDRVLMAQYKDHLGALLNAEGKQALAAAAYQEAQVLLLPEYAPTSIEEAPPYDQLKYAINGADLFLYLTDQARTLDAMAVGGAKYSDARLSLYRAGDALLDELRNRHDGDANKLFWRQKALPFYEAAIRACHQTGRTGQAFYFFEKSKAILLYEALAGSDALRELPDSMRAKEAELARVLANAQTNLRETKDRAGGLRGFMDAQSGLERFRDELRRQFPRYRALTERISVPDPATFYRDHLAPEGQVLVHYFFGPTQTFALTLGEEGIKTTRLGPNDSLRQITSRMLAYFTATSDIQNDPDGYAAAAVAAYTALVLPLHLRPRQKLLIIPDGPLTYLPFSALITGTNGSSGLGNLPYLIRQHPISYGHSASILGRKRVVENSASEIIAFAPFTDGTALLDYPTLRFSQDELSTVSTDFDLQLFQDGAATLAAFRAVNERANILHLSTHAFSSTEEQSPLIAFYDQPLYLSDLYHEKLSADLVVLSACQTNVGKLAGGEGVLGLGRGFIQAGAGSVIASLWNVNARGNSRVLSEFYQQLAAGSPKGSALHEAQLSLLNDKAIRDIDKSPYLWAGLTYYGAEGKLLLRPISPFSSWYRALFFAGLALIVLLAFRRLRGR